MSATVQCDGGDSEPDLSREKVPWKTSLIKEML